jgi:hypothetical protein
MSFPPWWMSRKYLGSSPSHSHSEQLQLCGIHDTSSRNHNEPEMICVSTQLMCQFLSMRRSGSNSCAIFPMDVSKPRLLSKGVPALAGILLSAKCLEFNKARAATGTSTRTRAALKARFFHYSICPLRSNLWIQGGPVEPRFQRWLENIPGAIAPGSQ